MQIFGTLAVKVCYLSQSLFDLELVVVSGDGPASWADTGYKSFI